jgi:hypothetical protein
LENFPVARLSDTSVLVVEAHLSSYAIPARGQSSGRNGYSMALRAIYVASESDPGLVESLPATRKRQGDMLVSPRRNKKAGQVAVFSDED